MCGGGDGGDGSGQCSNTHVGNVKLLFWTKWAKTSAPTTDFIESLVNLSMENRASVCAVGRKPKQFSMNCNVYLWVIRSYTHTYCEMSFYWEPMLIVHIFYGCVYTPSLPHSPSEHIPFTSFDQVYSQTVEMQWKWNWNCTHTEREKKTRDEWMDGLHTIS